MRVTVAAVNDGLMTVWRRILTWTSITMVGGVALAGLGIAFLFAGLDDADKIASVIGAFVGLIGLALSGYGVILARRGSTPQSTPGAQRVKKVKAGQGVDVVDTVSGNVRFGAPAPTATPPTPSPSSPPAPAVLGEQSVTDVQATGGVRIVRGVGGDLDVAP